MKAGKKKGKVGIEDIAKELKISASTVSRALNDHPRISRKTKEKVKQVASRLGYHPGMPELMNPEKIEVVVVLVPSLENSLYREIVSGITDFLNENNYQTFVIDTNGDDKRVNAFFKTYRKYGISGIIHLISNRTISRDYYSVIQDDAMPLVTVFEPDNDTGINSVLPDMFQGVFKIVKYIIALGIKNVSLLLEDGNKPEDFQLVSSFQMALEMLDSNKILPTVEYVDRNGESFAKKVTAILHNQKKPQLLLVKDILSAVEVSRIAEKMKINIPEDLLLIAFGAAGYSGLTDNLSLLKLPGYEMGYDAAEMLLEQIQNPETEEKTAIKSVDFILKGSAIRLKQTRKSY